MKIFISGGVVLQPNIDGKNIIKNNYKKVIQIINKQKVEYYQDQKSLFIELGIVGDVAEEESR